MDNREKDHRDLESPLGLADEPVKQHPSDRLPKGNEASRRRRERALGEDGIDRQSDGLGDMNVDPDGASGVDMGYGGEGHGIEPSDPKPR